MKKLVLLGLFVPFVLAAQAPGQAALRGVIVRTTDSTHAMGYGGAATLGLVGYRSVSLGTGLSVVYITEAWVPSVSLNVAYTPARFAAGFTTPYIGAEWNITGLPNATVPGYVLFVGFSINDQRRSRETRTLFDTPTTVMPGWIVEGRNGQFVRNGRYHELDIGYAP